MTPEQVEERNRRTLRAAAQSMRELHPISHPRHEMWDLMGGLCETVANGAAGGIVLAIAHSYLATVDRPDLDGSVHDMPQTEGYVVTGEHVGGCNGRCIGDRHYLIRGTT